MPPLLASSLSTSAWASATRRGKFSSLRNSSCSVGMRELLRVSEEIGLSGRYRTGQTGPRGDRSSEGNYGCQTFTDFTRSVPLHGPAELEVSATGLLVSARSAMKYMACC